MLLTFIVPFYNIPEKYITENINSFEQQKDYYRLFEVLYINDGSTQKYTQMLKGLLKGKKFNHEVVTKKNGKWASCINVGARMAKGKFVCEVDADDSVDLNFMKEIIPKIKLAKIYPNSLIVLSQRLKSSRGDKSLFFSPPEKKINLSSGKSHLGELPVRNCCVSKKVFDEIVFPEGWTMGVDWMYGFTIVNKSDFAFGTKATYVYNFDRPNNTMTRNWNAKTYYDSMSKITDFCFSQKVRNPLGGRIFFWLLLISLSFKWLSDPKDYVSRKKLFFRMMKKNRFVLYGSPLKAFVALMLPKQMFFLLLIFLSKKSLRVNKKTNTVCVSIKTSKLKKFH